MHYCKNCVYAQHILSGEAVCRLTHRINPNSCEYETENIENLYICFNCKHWMGAGDFGLSCGKNYYIASANGLRAACEEFER